MASDGTPWFVEIRNNAIGELVPTTNRSSISVNLQTSVSLAGPQGTIVMPVTFAESGASTGSTHLTLNVSGISANGIPTNMTASFGPNGVDLLPGQQATSSLTLATHNLTPGVYYLTLTAADSSRYVLDSIILKLTVTGSSPDLLPVALVALGVAIAAGAAYFALSRSRARRD